jgi:hypothetical protein
LDNISDLLGNGRNELFGCFSVRRDAPGERRQSDRANVTIAARISSPKQITVCALCGLPLTFSTFPEAGTDERTALDSAMAAEQVSLHCRVSSMRQTGTRSFVMLRSSLSRTM